jgi:magnesium-transporting ATPase (P-type)
MQKNQQITAPGLVRRASFRQKVIAAIIFLAAFLLFGFLHLAAIGKIDIDRWLNPCGFKQKYNLPCPTCGMTTSAIAFVQGRILEAFYIQPAAALLLCVLVIAAFLAFFTAVFGVYLKALERFFAEVRLKYIVLILIIIIVAAWAITLARNSFESAPK